MFKLTLAVLLLSSAAVMAEQPDSQTSQTVKERALHLDDYRCTVNEYTAGQRADRSDRQSDKKEIIHTVYVKKGAIGEHTPATPFPAGKISYAVTRSEGMISVEVRNENGEVVTISSVRDGKALGVKVPLQKQILTCNPPLSLVVKQLKVDLNDFEHLNVDPSTYSESMTIQRFDPSILSKYKLLKELRATRSGLTPEEKAKIRELDQQNSAQQQNTSVTK